MSPLRLLSLYFGLLREAWLVGLAWVQLEDHRMPIRHNVSKFSKNYLRIRRFGSETVFSCGRSWNDEG